MDRSLQRYRFLPRLVNRRSQFGNSVSDGFVFGDIYSDEVGKLWLVVEAYIQGVSNLVVQIS